MDGSRTAIARNPARHSIDLPQDVDLVIFDCDGVLVDSEAICCSMLSATLREIGLAISPAYALERFLGRGFGAIEDFALARTGLPLPPAFRSDLAARVAAAFVDLRPIEGAADAVRRLPVRSCVGSSSDRARVFQALGHTGMLDLFEGRIWTIENVTRGKPAPDIFLHAIARMGGSPARTLVIEDSVNGVTAARAADLRVWGFVGGAHYADCIPRLTEAGAALIFDDMRLLWSQER